MCIPDRFIWEAQLVVRRPSKAPDATPPLREIGQQEDLLANLMLHVFTYCWFEMTWKYLTWDKSSYLTFVLYCFVDIGH